MKKIVLLSIIVLTAACANAQTTPDKPNIQTNENQTKQEVKKALNDLVDVIAQVDVDKIEKFLDNSINKLDKNVTIIIDEAKKVDKQKIEKSVEKLAQSIERGIDNLEIEKRVDKIEKQLEKKN
jgi:hypothetical protein